MKKAILFSVGGVAMFGLAIWADRRGASPLLVAPIALIAGAALGHAHECYKHRNGVA